MAAKRLNIDWDSAAEIEEEDRSDESEVPSVVVLMHPTFFTCVIHVAIDFH